MRRVRQPAAKRKSPAEKETDILGTAFFVSYRIDGAVAVDGGGGYQDYVVTAKHVIAEAEEEEQAEDHNIYLPSTHLRIRTSPPIYLSRVRIGGSTTTSELT